MQLQTAVGRTIRNLRKERNMTLRQLCGKSYLALGFMSEIEVGTKNASNSTLEAIAKGLDITTTQLIFEIYTYLEEQGNG